MAIQENVIAGVDHFRGALKTFCERLYLAIMFVIISIPPRNDKVVVRIKIALTNVTATSSPKIKPFFDVLDDIVVSRVLVISSIRYYHSGPSSPHPTVCLSLSFADS